MRSSVCKLRVVLLCSFAAWSGCKEKEVSVEANRAGPVAGAQNVDRARFR
jgi:hypothetical protein